MNTWPSERVTQGGFLHNAKISYSRETQDLLKVLMEESRLTMMQRKKITSYLRNGEQLPSLQDRAPPQQPSANPTRYRAKSCRRRTLDSILESDAFNVEKFVPRNAYKQPSEVAKLKLQEKMSGYVPDVQLEKLKSKFKHGQRNLEADFDPEDEILGEINERVEWLNEMEKLGEAKKHRMVIEAQIQDKLVELRQMQSRRN